MPGIPVTSVVQVTINYQHFLQRLMNVLHYTCVEEATAGTIASETQAIANLIGSAGGTYSFIDKLLPILPSTVQIDEIRVQVIHPERYAYRFKTVALLGERSESLTANIDVAFTKRSDSAGRSKQGNVFLPGIPKDDFLNGIVTEEYAGALDLNGQIFKSSIATANDGVYAASIFHRDSGTVTPVTSVYTHTTVRCMTRRTVGRGV